MSTGTATESSREALPASPVRLALRGMLRRPGALFGGSVLCGMVLLALLAPWISPYDPLATSWSLVRKAPSAAHWFGTDEVGRDLLSRVIWGARASLLAGVIAVAIAVGVGVPVGMLAGYLGGWTDALISRLNPLKATGEAASAGTPACECLAGDCIRTVETTRTGIRGVAEEPPARLLEPLSCP